MHEHCTPQRGGSRYPAMKTTVNESSSPSSSFKCCARRACPLILVGTRAQALAKRTRDGCREVGRFRINPERMFVSPKTLAICCEQKTVLISFCWVQNYHSSAHNLLSPVGMALSFGFSFRCEQLLFFGWLVIVSFGWNAPYERIRVRASVFFPGWFMLNLLFVHLSRKEYSKWCNERTLLLNPRDLKLEIPRNGSMKQLVLQIIV